MDEDTPNDAPPNPDPPDHSATQEIGRNTLRTEARIRGIGLLFLGLAPVFILLFLVLVDSGNSRWLKVTMLLLAAPSFYAGLGLRRLKPKARIVAAAISCIASLLFPYGAVGTALTLLVLFSPATKTVFSANYRQIAAVAGRRRPDLSWLDTLGLVLLFPLLAIGVTVGVLLRLHFIGPG